MWTKNPISSGGRLDEQISRVDKHKDHHNMLSVPDINDISVSGFLNHDLGIKF